MYHFRRLPLLAEASVTDYLQSKQHKFAQGIEDILNFALGLFVAVSRVILAARHLSVEGPVTWGSYLHRLLTLGFDGAEEHCSERGPRQEFNIRLKCNLLEARLYSSPLLPFD